MFSACGLKLSRSEDATHFTVTPGNVTVEMSISDNVATIECKEYSWNLLLLLRCYLLDRNVDEMIFGGSEQSALLEAFGCTRRKRLTASPVPISLKWHSRMDLTRFGFALQHKVLDIAEAEVVVGHTRYLDLEHVNCIVLVLVDKDEDPRLLPYSKSVWARLPRYKVMAWEPDPKKLEKHFCGLVLEEVPP